MNKVIIIDTSVFCVYLKLPGWTSCGKGANTWDFESIDQKLKNEETKGTSFVLPLATIIETGNHISQSTGNRYQLAERFGSIMIDCADDKDPWTAFSQQADLWTDETLKNLAGTWPELAAQKISIGDATIKEVADYYARTGYIEVEIFSGDAGLKAYQPPLPKQIGVPTPRRRKR